MMTLTPQSMRSPVSSPYNQHSKQSFSSRRPFYPTTPQPESSALESAQNRGLGLFECSLAPSQSSVNTLPPSPQPSDSWSHSSVMEQDFPQSSQPPDISSAAYDPFSGFSTAFSTGMVSGHSPEAPGLVYCHTPPSTNLPSPHRSSVSSSYTPIEAYAHNGAGFRYTPTVKVEDANEWYPSLGNGPIIHGALTTQGLSNYSNDVSPASAAPTADEWSKPALPVYPSGLHDTDETPIPKFSILQSEVRTKKKRQRTTPEEATHECRVCGKLFKRSYNWKSHLETHNPDRKYPHPCPHVTGDTPCAKKFQRKTDLDRHVDSVHHKTRNHPCTLCGRRFARRDTLRRHMEDGCTKRLELGFRDGSAATPARWSFTNFPARSRSYSDGTQQPSPMAPQPGSLSSSATFPVFTSTANGSSNYPS